MKRKPKIFSTQIIEEQKKERKSQENKFDEKTNRIKQQKARKKKTVCRLSNEALRILPRLDRRGN